MSVIVRRRFRQSQIQPRLTWPWPTLSLRQGKTIAHIARQHERSKSHPVRAWPLPFVAGSRPPRAIAVSPSRTFSEPSGSASRSTLAEIRIGGYGSLKSFRLDFNFLV